MSAGRYTRHLRRTFSGMLVSLLLMGMAVPLWAGQIVAGRFPLLPVLLVLSGVAGVFVCVRHMLLVEGRRAAAYEYLKQKEQRLSEYAALLNRTACSLQKKQTELEEFIYTISHDLKAPVFSIQGFSRLLETENGHLMDEKGEFYVGRIAENCQTVYRRIEDLLALSRIGRTGEQVESVDLDEIVEEVFDSGLPHASRKQIELKKTGCLPPVQGWQRRLLETFENLVGNAIAHMPEGRRGVVEVGFDPSVVSGDSVAGAYYVKDNGPGINAELQKDIFKLFVRGEEDGPQGNGSGIGLAIVKRVVENHGGRIWVESSPDRGTIFYLTLPGIVMEEDMAPQRDCIRA